jgi:hypothetical protein
MSHVRTLYHIVHRGVDGKVRMGDGGIAQVGLVRVDNERIGEKEADSRQ